LGVDEDLDTTGCAGLAPNEACALEGEHHLVDGWRGNAEMALQIGLGRRSSEHLGVGVDEGQILPLLRGEARDG